SFNRPARMGWTIPPLASDQHRKQAVGSRESRIDLDRPLERAFRLARQHWIVPGERITPDSKVLGTRGGGRLPLCTPRLHRLDTPGNRPDDTADHQAFRKWSAVHSLVEAIGPEMLPGFGIYQTRRHAQQAADAADAALSYQAGLCTLLPI